jgi:ferric-dicitrate binding protein FerR (iron transport regulator)
MYTFKKNNLPEWELLSKVLSGETPENDPAFQHWLEEDVENGKLYRALTGKKQPKHLPFDKNKAFNNISDILGLSIGETIPFYRKYPVIVRYAASLSTIAAVGLTAYFILTREPTTEPAEYTAAGKNIFEPGSKKAYLLSSQGKTIDLAESFELKSNDGTIISNKSEGIVSFQQHEPAQKQKQKKVEQHTIYVPKGGEYELSLTDGSKVFLNSETQLVFPSRFEGGARQIELTGEAYFEIKKDVKPFIVKTNGLQIEVLGTSFNVNAYPDNAFVNATLVEGCIDVHVADHPEVFRIKPENSFSINKSSNEISIRKVNTEIYTAWVKGEFIFRNQPLSDILTQLARWYDFEIEYENPAVQTMRFTGSAEKVRPLNYLLNQIQTVTDVKYRNEGDKIILY